MNCGYVVKVEQLRKHTNADRLQVATFFGNDTIVDMTVKQGDLGVYFPVNLQLSKEYAETNNLLRKKDDSGNNIGGFLDPDHRNIKAIKLRGEKSDGLFMPLRSFDYCFAPKTAAEANLAIGELVTTLNGKEICCKYVPRTQNRVGHITEGNRTRKKKVPTAPLFAEHADTEQLAYNLGAFKPGDEIEITLKMHGTSQRTGYLPIHVGYKDSIFRRIINKIVMGLKVRKDWGNNGRNALYHSLKHGEPIYDYGYVSGTRRVVLENYEGGFYGNNEFREQHSKVFEGKLNKGETVYYEVVGFTTSGAPIMGDANNKKLNDKEFIKQYGETTRFSYGCSPTGTTEIPMSETGLPYGAVVSAPQSDIYVYRMTMTNEDGFVVEYTPDFMRYRCEQMGVKTVPVFAKGTLSETRDGFPFFDYRNCLTNANSNVTGTLGDCVKYVAELFYDGPDPIGKTHIREGVVVRIVNRPKFCAYKHKNFPFKVLEGIIQESVVQSSADLSEDILAEM